MIDNGFPFGDDVGVVTPWQHPGAREADLTADSVVLIREAVGSELRWRESKQADMWVGKAVAPILGLSADDDAVEVKKAIKDLIRKRVLETVPGRDERRQERTFVVAAGTPGL